MLSTGNQLPSHFTDEEMEAPTRSLTVTDDNKNYFLFPSGPQSVEGEERA